MDPYRIAKDSPVTRATVDSKSLLLGDDYIDLTDSQVKRLQAIGVKLEKAPSGS